MYAAWILFSSNGWFVFVLFPFRGLKAWGLFCIAGVATLSSRGLSPFGRENKRRTCTSWLSEGRLLWLLYVRVLDTHLPGLSNVHGLYLSSVMAMVS